MISMPPVRPGAGVRYLFGGVLVGDGHRRAGTALRDAQDEAGVPPGVWKAGAWPRSVSRTGTW